MEDVEIPEKGFTRWHEERYQDGYREGVKIARDELEDPNESTVRYLEGLFVYHHNPDADGVLGAVQRLLRPETNGVKQGFSDTVRKEYGELIDTI